MIVAVMLGAVVAAPATPAQEKAAKKVAPKAKAKGKGAKAAAPPRVWKEHWFEHKQAMKLVEYNDDVAIYFDDAVPRDEGIAWLTPFMTKAWKYTKKTYGPFGGPKDRLFALFHQGRYSGGHPSTYFDESHDFRNVTDCGPGPWDESAVDLASHEIGHIVEGASRGVHDSPAFGLWKDSKWIELYQYDLYLGIGREEDAKRVFAKFSAQADDFPRPGTHWFRDFFHPAWEAHGKSKFMANYFRLLAEFFPKEPENDGRNVHYSRELNWGEFVHFLSAAAGKDLKPLAKKAFGWPEEWEGQWQKAREDFPELTYKS